MFFQYVYLFEKNIPDLNGTLIDPIQQQRICMRLTDQPILKYILGKSPISASHIKDQKL